MNNTVEAIATVIVPMSPICFANPSMKPFSVVVFVSAPEFANIVSNVWLKSTAFEGSLILTMYQPTVPDARSVRFCSR
jgi:hypothetical protein